MDYLKEFLQSSTIHGLAYIADSPSKLSKCFWLSVVIFGFSTAFNLIHDSYDDWQASPIATSISTHPISELEFPTITVCPPENSNTALNYDLMRARNITLTDKDRQALINLTKEMLIDKPSSEFVKLVRALTNEVVEVVWKQTYSYCSSALYWSKWQNIWLRNLVFSVEWKFPNTRFWGKEFLQWDFW